MGDLNQLTTEQLTKVFYLERYVSPQGRHKAKAWCDDHKEITGGGRAANLDAVLAFIESHPQVDQIKTGAARMHEADVVELKAAQARKVQEDERREQLRREANAERHAALMDAARNRTALAVIELADDAVSQRWNLRFVVLCIRCKSDKHGKRT